MIVVETGVFVVLTPLGAKASQRDCVPQPKVAVLGYLGRTESDGSNPNGVAAVLPIEGLPEFNKQ